MFSVMILVFSVCVLDLSFKVPKDFISIYSFFFLNFFLLVTYVGPQSLAEIKLGM